MADDPYASIAKPIEDPYAAMAKPVSSGAMARFARSFNSAVGIPESVQDNPAEAIEGIKQSVLHPGLLAQSVGEMGKGVWTGMKETGQKAIDAWKGGHPLDAAGYAIESGIPVIGPAFARAGEQVASGDVAGGLGTAAGTVAPAAVAHPAVRAAAVDAVKAAAPAAIKTAATSALGKVPSPIGNTLNKPRGTVPAEAATPAELQAYAEANNIPINAAQATEHSIPRNLQSVGERTTVGGTQVRAQTKAAQAAVVQHAQNLMDQFSPNTPDVGAAGSAIKGNVQSALEKEQTTARGNYANVDKQANSGPAPVAVDLTEVKKTAAKLLQESDFIRQSVPSLDAKRAAGVLKAITQLPDSATFSQVQDLRSALLNEGMHPENAINTQAQGWIKQLSGVTDGQMADAAKANPQLEAAFRTANEHWKSLQEDFNNPRSPLFQILQEPDPSKIPQKLTQKGQIGGSPYNVGLLDKYGIDKGGVKWAITGDLVNKDFGLYQGGKSLGGYSDNFLRQVFEPQELDSIYKTGAIARSTRLNTNPSGTAAVEQAASEVRNPIKAAAHGGAAALTNSETFNNWLLKNPQPSKSAAPAVMKQWLNARQAQLRAARVTLAAGSSRKESGE